MLDREAFEERAAIMEFDGGMQRRAAEERARHECEARQIARMATHQERADYLAAVALHRGQEAADSLRRDAWGILCSMGVAGGH